MLPDIKYFPVNWIDGMKISSRDFISLENAVKDEIRDAQATRLNEFAYGLLPTNHPEVDNYPRLTYDYANNILLLKECRALMPGGQRIEITESNYDRKKFPVQLPSVPVSLQDSGKFDVYLHVDTSVRVGAGEFAQNNPPRYVAISPQYELAVRVHDGTHIENENFLKISELEIREGRVEILTNTGKYIPPCTTLNAFAGLMQKHGNGEERLKGLLKHYTILVNNVGKETRNEVALEAITLSENLVSPIISSLSHYQYILPSSPPIFTVVYFKDFARFVRFKLDRPFRAPIDQLKTELLELTAVLERTEPRHAAIQLSFDRIMQFLDSLVTFLAELSTHNYNRVEYDVHDLNYVTASGPRVKPIEKEPKPVEAPLPPPTEEKKSQRVF